MSYDCEAMLARVRACLEGKVTDKNREKAARTLEKFVATKRFRKGAVSSHADKCAMQAFEDIMSASWKPDEEDFDGFSAVYAIINTLHRTRGLFDAHSVLRLLALMHGRWEENTVYDIEDDEFWFQGIMMHLFAVALTLKEPVHPKALYDLVWGQWLTLGRKLDADAKDLIGRGLLRDMGCEEFGYRLYFNEMPLNAVTVAAIKELMEKNNPWNSASTKRECPCCGTMTNAAFQK